MALDSTSHTAASAKPGLTAGDRTLNWFDKLFSAVIGIATLGAGFTFSVIVTVPGDLPEGASLTKDGVRFCLALSWLLFVLALGAASAAALGFSFGGPLTGWLRDGVDEKRRGPELAAAFTSLVLQLLLLAAFMASAWAVAAYVGGVGWAAVVLTACFSILLVTVWASQNLFFTAVWKALTGSQSPPK